MIATETHPTPRRRRWQLFSTFLVMAQSMSDEDVVAVLMDLDLGRKLSGEDVSRKMRGYFSANQKSSILEEIYF